MTCPDKSTLMMWVDGELPESEAKSISEHTRYCSNCRGFVSAQKQMESVWRDAWVDPADAHFETMRRKLKPVVPWWRTQRTWYIAAAVCAVYIGVKIFYVDGAGKSLSEIAAEETSPTVRVTTEEIPETPVEEIIEGGCDGLEEEIGIPQQEFASGQSGISEIQEELSVHSRLSATDSERADEEEDVLLEGDFTVASPENSLYFGVTATGYLQDTCEVSDLPVATGECEETDELCWDLGSVSSTEPGGLDTGAGTLSGGVGGAISGSAGLSCDDLTDSVQRVCPSQMEATAEASVYEGYRISITLESKEIIQIQRYQWNSLFLLIDSLRPENRYSIGEPLVLRISNEGIVSGPDVLTGTVIDLPETGYGDCAVTVLFD